MLRYSPSALLRSPTFAQAARFVLVGLSGFAVNLAAFSIARAAGVGTLTAAALAFCVAVTNNYLWNRAWTFRAHRGRGPAQGLCFLIVSLAALGCNLLVLGLLVDAGVASLPAQAAAIAVSVPVNFIGCKLWAFAPRETHGDWRRVGKGLRSLSLGLAGALVIAVTAWGLEAAALRPPTRAALVAARSSGWLHGHRLAVAVFRVGDRRVRGTCRGGWFLRPHHHRHRRAGALLDLDPGPVVIAWNSRKFSLISGRRNRYLPARLAIDVSCTPVLETKLGLAAQLDRLTLRRARIAGREALALTSPLYRGERFTILVSPRTAKPLAVEVSLFGRTTFARLQLLQPHRTRASHRRPRTS